jgi:DNA-binding response OmpR family regulator
MDVIDPTLHLILFAVYMKKQHFHTRIDSVTLTVDRRCVDGSDREGSKLSRIAVVEDDFELSRLMRDVLRDSGHEVLSYVQPSTDIVTNITDSRPDLVIVDLRLNDSVSGWDIIAALRRNELTRSIPLILCTGAADQVGEQQWWLDGEGVPVLPKPFDIDELENIVTRMLAAPAV